MWSKSRLFWQRLGCCGVAIAVSSAAFDYHAQGMPATFSVSREPAIEGLEITFLFRTSYHPIIQYIFVLFFGRHGTMQCFNS